MFERFVHNNHYSIYSLVCVCIGRFGSPGNVEETYSVFAQYYMKTFNCATGEIMCTCRVEVLRVALVHWFSAVESGC